MQLSEMGIATIEQGRPGDRRNAGHLLDTAGHHQVLGTGPYPHYSQVEGGQTRAAIAVDREAGCAGAPPRVEHRLPGDTACLLVYLRKAADYDVGDVIGVYAVSLLQRGEH